MQYRREIDGLRALAVVPVILAHARFPLITGGYVGVDIFFVISGFLISGIIYDDVKQGRFSFIGFYERRARRILPALILVVLACIPACYFLMLPDSYENFGQSVFATLLFSNNVLLALTSGYWALASDFKPLLHTWSLGVEEQFYVLYPLVVVLVLKLRPAAFAPTIAVIAVVSLGLSIVESPLYPDASFYLLHTRAWELMLGGLAAYMMTHREARGGDQLLATLGLALVLAAMFTVRDGIPYPYVYALLPCIGTVLVLMFGQSDTAVGRLLALRPLVGIGLISYSAYLWHQPIFVLARLVRTTEPPRALYAALIGVTILLAYLTWRHVEQPFRDRRRISRNQVFGVTILGSATLAGTGLAIALLHGLSARVPGMGLEDKSFIAFNEDVFRFKTDAFSPGATHKLLVLGNSTARDFVNVMIASGRFRQSEIVYRDDLDPCRPIVVPLQRALVRAADGIVVVANWTFDGKCRRLMLDGVARAGTPAILVGPKHFGYNLDAYMLVPRSARPEVRATLLPDTTQSDAAFRRIAPPGRYLDLLAILDRRFGGVPIFDGEGRIISIDRVHLTEAGARLFGGIAFDDPAWRGFPVAAVPRRAAQAMP